VKSVIKLNEDFSERINQFNGIACDKDASGLDENRSNEDEKLNMNKKRVLSVQKGREDSDSE
jgi:hypothetical protein